jgi:signal transduction histidine kinase
MMIQINVSDTGPGIPQEHLTHIFQPFFTTDKDNGTGLGLAITQRIIIAHKGKIQVESFPGGGTVFHIQLPAVHLH